MKKCIFCEIIEKKLPAYKIFENNEYIVILDINPINKGHSLIIPKIHEDYIFNLNEKKYLNLWKAAKKIAKILKKATKAKRIGIAVEGFTVPHIHIHLVPVNSPNELNPLKSHKASKKELLEIKRKILSLF